jgi:hypothetical protein
MLSFGDRRLPCTFTFMMAAPSCQVLTSEEFFEREALKGGLGVYPPAPLNQMGSKEVRLRSPTADRTGTNRIFGAMDWPILDRFRLQNITRKLLPNTLEHCLRWTEAGIWALFSPLRFACFPWMRPCPPSVQHGDFFLAPPPLPPL